MKRGFVEILYQNVIIFGRFVRAPPNMQVHVTVPWDSQVEIVQAAFSGARCRGVVRVRFFLRSLLVEEIRRN